MSNAIGGSKEDEIEMGSLLTHVAMQIPREIIDLPPNLTSSKKSGKKQDVLVEKPAKNAANMIDEKKDADSDSEIDLGKSSNFAPDFHEMLQDTLDKKLPSFFRRKTSVQRDEKQVKELVYKGQSRANTNRDTVTSLLEEKKKER